jgi:hypothetical protein
MKALHGLRRTALLLPLTLAAACATAPTAERPAGPPPPPSAPTLPEVVRSESASNGGVAVHFEAGDSSLTQKVPAPDACSTRWTLYPAGNLGERSIRIETQCGQDPSTRLDKVLPLFKAALNAILKEIAPTALKSADGQFYQWSLWNTRVTDLAKTHNGYLTYLEKRGNRGYESPKPFFVKVFNDADAGREMRALFAERGLKLEAKSAEKIFEKRIGRQLLPTGAGVLSFSLTPLAAPQAASSPN